MADVPQRLRTAREQAGLSIDDLAARTKIKPAALLAIERGDYAALPGEFFARAFLRSYARELRLPDAELLAQYDSERTPPPEALPAGEPETPHVTHAEPVVLDAPRSAWPLAALVALILLALFVFTRGTPEPDTPQPVGTAGAVEAPRPVTRADPAPPADDKLRIEIRPTRPLWVTAFADGTRVLFRTIEPGERVAFEANDEMTFRVGDAGAFEFTLNGAPGKRPGADGEVRDFTITRENASSLVR